MSIKSEMKRCYKCGSIFLEDPNNVIKGCPYCVKKEMAMIKMLDKLIRKIKRIFGMIQR